MDYLKCKDLQIGCHENSLQIARAWYSWEYDRLKPAIKWFASLGKYEDSTISANEFYDKMKGYGLEIRDFWKLRRIAKYGLSDSTATHWGNIK